MKASKLAKLVRTLTLAPIMAAVTLTILYVCTTDVFQSVLEYMGAIAFLVILPILAYPLQPFIPSYKEKGREGQRQLAIVMAVLGYIGGIIVAVSTSIPEKQKIIYFMYFFSGILIMVFNKVIKVRASGHACGVVGPVAILTYCMGPLALFGLIVLVVVYWASLKMERHTISQLFWGSAIPVVALLISYGIYQIA